MFECAVDCGFAGLHDFASDDHLVQNLVDFVKIEHEVQLAHTPEVLIEHLYEQVNELNECVSKLGQSYLKIG